MEYAKSYIGLDSRELYWRLSEDLKLYNYNIYSNDNCFTRSFLLTQMEHVHSFLEKNRKCIEQNQEVFGISVINSENIMVCSKESKEFREQISGFKAGLKVMDPR